MNMIIHPLFVHFPIALFTIYALLECMRFKKTRLWTPLFYTKAILLIIGSASSVPTYLSGEIQEEAFRGSPLEPALNAHSSWALATVLIFGFLALCYLLAWIRRDLITTLPTPPSALKIFWLRASSAATFIITSPLSLILSFIGLIAVTVTGALGGSLVYGSNVDPFVSFIYTLLKLPKN